MQEVQNQLCCYHQEVSQFVIKTFLPTGVQLTKRLQQQGKEMPSVLQRNNFFSLMKGK